MELQKRISKKALSVWRINGLIHTGAYISSSGPLLHFWVYYSIGRAWCKSSFGELSSFVLYTVSLFFRHSATNSGDMRSGRQNRLKEGLFIVEKTLVPMVRVQHVDISQGPIMKKYGLSSIGISTAATVHEIPALENEEAEELRHYISSMVQRVREDV